METFGKYKLIDNLVDELDKTIDLVLDKELNELMIRKVIYKPCNFELYKQLKLNPINGISKITSVNEEDEAVVIIEEYIQGKTMDKVLLEREFSDNEVRSIVLQLCTILGSLHQLKPPIIHRDLKPENIIFHKGKVKLIDFDIARNYCNDKRKDTHVLGSVGYAAPEQFGFAQSDWRVDIYALGILINEMLIGEIPQEKIVSGKWNKIVSKCIELDPENRYQSCEKLQRDIYRYIESPKKMDVKKRISGINIPGFRSKNLRNMMIACFGYLLIIFTTVTVELKGDNVRIVETILMKIALFFWLITCVILMTNYNDIFKMIIRYEFKSIKNEYIARAALSYLTLVLYLIMEAIILSFFTV